MAGLAGEPAAAPSIDQIIIAEHNRVRHLFNEYAKSADKHQKQQLVYLIIREISMHSTKEEAVMYPVIGKHFGKDAQLHCVSEHHSIKEKLELLDRLSVAQNEDQADELVAQIKLEFEQHGEEEETREIPRLLQAPGVDPLELGALYLQAEATALTRPHPEAPDMPPANLESAPMMAEMDRKADMQRFGGHIPTLPNMPGVIPSYQMPLGV